MEGRRQVTRADLAQAEAVLRLGQDARGRIGFLSGLPAKGVKTEPGEALVRPRSPERKR